MIPPTANGQFVAAIEDVLDVYKRPYARKYPIVCMDESPKQPIGETRVPIKMRSGRSARCDFEYERRVVCNIFMINEPLLGKRHVKVTEKKTKLDWAEFIKEIADDLCPKASKITLVMDNLATHKPGALYEAIPPAEAKRICDRFEFVYTPKHGSWLNMAEIELNVLTKQCLNRRIDNMETIKTEVRAWQSSRNGKKAVINWRLTTKDARIKLKKLYPTILY